MQVIECQRELPWSRTQVLDLILDIERYPEFLPWCKSVTHKQGNFNDPQGATASMTLNFQLITQTILTNIKLYESENRIEIRQIEGIFQVFSCHWHITTLPSQNCKVSFTAHYQLGKMSLANKIFLSVFQIAIKKIVDAFYKRGQILYN